ncbi:MAG: CheR family methyltransferase [Candidatus Acidiferrales bacterium]|jgi:chemotaxis protein methyltransferase WspC
MLTEIENLLAERLGFDIHSVGLKAVEAVVRRSMKDSGVSNPAAYARMLASDLDAWYSLVDRVVIPETWFFRDIAPFALAADLGRAHAQHASAKGMRILSCPCSTGEEPYSLAMAMLHAGAPPEAFTVDAIDVSPRALKSAQAAAFSKRSFRDPDPWYRSRYFDPVEAEGSWQLKKSVIARVRFRQGNLMAPDFLNDFPGDGLPYDLVLCRNLLIYLHREARLRAMAHLRGLVAEHGVLVVGHAETSFAREHGFQQTGSAAAFAFVKPGHRLAPKPASVCQPNVEPQKGTPSVAPRVSNAAAGSPSAVPTVRVDAPAQDADLSLLVIARQMGDAGELQDALRLCREHLQRVPDSAEGHFLLGVLHDALGHQDLAVRSFRKVLYLNPTHRDALLHLALKQEARGDGSGAALLRARARRSPDDFATE